MALIRWANLYRYQDRL